MSSSVHQSRAISATYSIVIRMCEMTNKFMELNFWTTKARSQEKVEKTQIIAYFRKK